MSKTSTHNNAELRASVANCIMGGNSVTRKNDGWIRDLVEFDCGGYRFVFRQKPEVISRDFNQHIGTFYETTEVTVADVAPNKVQAVEAAIGRICWLLSFAGTCQVIPFEYEYPNGSGHRHSKSASGTVQNFRPAFEMVDGAQLKSFVEQTYEKYTRLELSRKLNVVIAYLVQAERPFQPTEVRLILVFVALESLKDTFARCQSIPYVKGFFRKPPKKPGGDGAKYLFEELLTMMFRQVGMRRGLKRVIQLRNDLIHSGLSRKPHSRQMSLYADVHDLIREYLLRLLGYRGRYSPYAFERRGVSAEIK